MNRTREVLNDQYPTIPDLAWFTEAPLTFVIGSMMLNRTVTGLVCFLIVRPQAVKATLWGLGLLMYSAVALAAKTMPASTAYAADPQHLWNQLTEPSLPRRSRCWIGSSGYTGNG